VTRDSTTNLLFGYFAREFPLSAASPQDLPNRCQDGCFRWEQENAKERVEIQRRKESIGQQMCDKPPEQN
jgi:hypothetical protein